MRPPTDKHFSGLFGAFGAQLDHCGAGERFRETFGHGTAEEAQNVWILLFGGAHDLFRRVEVSYVDDFETGVAQQSRQRNRRGFFGQLHEDNASRTHFFAPAAAMTAVVTAAAVAASPSQKPAPGFAA